MLFIREDESNIYNFANKKSNKPSPSPPGINFLDLISSNWADSSNKTKYFFSRLPVAHREHITRSSIWILFKKMETMVCGKLWLGFIKHIANFNLYYKVSGGRSKNETVKQSLGHVDFVLLRNRRLLSELHKSIG